MVHKSILKLHVKCYGNLQNTHIAMTNERGIISISLITREITASMTLALMRVAALRVLVQNKIHFQRLAIIMKKGPAMAIRVFIHGLESSSQGTKGVFFRTRYPDMIIEDFVGTFKERMNKLNDILFHKKNLILVGSSYGGLMAAVYTAQNEEKIKKLILLAPALNIDEFTPYSTKKLTLPVIMYHGKHDNVVRPAAVRDAARAVFTNLQYHLVDDDHSLHETFSLMDWDTLLHV